MHCVQLILFSLICTVQITNCLSQSAGDLDITFDIDGTVTTSIGSSHDYINSIIMQTDGKIIAAGNTLNNNYHIAVARYNNDGSLDNTFNTIGYTTTSYSSQDDCRSVAIQADNKIVITGSADPDGADEIIVVRYNSDGSLDNSFNGDGIATHAIGTTDDKGTTIKLQSDNKIVVAGMTQNGLSYDFAILRFNSDGTLDNSFDTDGIVTTGFIGSTSNEQANGMALQDDGKIVVVGYIGGSFSSHNIAVARYNTDGSLDNTFSGDGLLIIDIAGMGDQANSVTLQPDGKILIAGLTHNGSNFDFVLIRLLPNGDFDNSFDFDGKVITDFNNSNDISYTVMLQSDGKISLAGTSYIGANRSFAVATYNSDGTLYNGFSGDGKVITSFPSSSIDDGLAGYFQADGKILVAGKSYNGSNDDFAIARYYTNLNVSLEVESGNEITIYPNPVINGEITVKLSPNSPEITSIEILNLDGSLVYSFSPQEIYIQNDNTVKLQIVDNLKSGNYLLLINFTNHKNFSGKVSVKQY